MLQERLGRDATLGLVELFDAEREKWKEDVLNTAADRFERRLTEQVSGARVDFAGQLSALREELHRGLAGVRVELHEGLAACRAGFESGQSALRAEIQSGQSALRADLIKWSFLFWVGQLAAIAGLLAYIR
jgi:hypothetical protein